MDANAGNTVRGMRKKVLKMDEYIELENAIAWFMPYAHAGESIDADVAISDIKGMKSADVEPVRHGRWVKRGGKWQCTHCKVLMSIDGTPKENLLNYCPNCGAKMGGGGTRQ